MKKENKALFLYTALIFLVSILMILIAFVGQNNIKNLQPETDESGESITQKIDKLCEDNRLLLQEKVELQNNVDLLSKDNNNLSEENRVLKSFLEIMKLIDEDKLEEAKNIYNNISADTLTEEQKIIYDYITNKISN